MNWLELAKLAGAAAVPINAVATFFFGMMNHALTPVEVRFAERLPAAGN